MFPPSQPDLASVQLHELRNFGNHDYFSEVGGAGLEFQTVMEELSTVDPAWLSQSNNPLGDYPSFFFPDTQLDADPLSLIRDIPATDLEEVFLSSPLNLELCLLSESVVNEGSPSSSTTQSGHCTPSAFERYPAPCATLPFLSPRSPASPCDPLSCSSSRKPRAHQRPRHVQVSSVADMESLMDRESLSCLVQGCTHPRLSRLPDLQRHVRTHLAGSRWACLGKPVDAGEAAVDVESRGGTMYEHQGRMTVGGCLETFSRLDAYQRHLKRGQCVGLRSGYKVGEDDMEYLEALRMGRKTR